MARKRATLSDLMNELTFRTNFNKYKLISLNLFKWEGLPEGIEDRHVEQLLFNDGVALFFKDPSMSFMCLKADPGAHLNVNGDPLGYWATGFNYHEYYDIDNCVVIRNNKLMLPTQDFIYYYAYKLTEVDRTADVNVKACKTPYVFTCDDKDLLSFKQIFNKIDGNEPAIYADKALNPDALNVLKTGVTFLGNDLQSYRHTIENELLTFLGVNNVNVEKKERLITDEAEANNELIQSFAALQLTAREKACEEINKLYGLNIRVSLRNCGNVENFVENPEGGDE